MKLSLFGKQTTTEAKKENNKEMMREWQRKLRAEIREIERSIKKVERDEEKIKKDIQKMAKQGSDPGNIKTLAKSIVRSGAAKARLYNGRAAMSAAASEIQNMAATMRLSDSMAQSTEVMKQIHAIVKIPELTQNIEGLKVEMMRAGLIEEMMDEGMEELDGPEMEEEATAEVDKVLDELAIDAAIRLAITSPGGREAAASSAAAAEVPTAAASETRGHAATAAA
eukprot:TRINITY_DN24264_c0_g1_i1.p1 TRINITY_DN24264_c0_g1~~TRINITY_DN24264_c0_g1_i1.p1  ORF type:complete len:225 (+),score=66.63 TRINITY_DN24264_c0_g1_i1:158-832(+)